MCRFRTISGPEAEKRRSASRWVSPAEYFADGLDPEVEQAVVPPSKGCGNSVPTSVRSSCRRRMRRSRPTTSSQRPKPAPIWACYDGVRFGRRGRREYGSAGDVFADQGRGIRVRGETPDYMLGTRAERRLLRRLAGGKAQAVRTLIRREFESAFETRRLDRHAGDPDHGIQVWRKAQDPLQMYLSDICHDLGEFGRSSPAISLPCGSARHGLPIGLQPIGGRLKRETLLRGAHAYEQATNWRAKKLVVRSADKGVPMIVEVAAILVAIASAVLVGYLVPLLIQVRKTVEEAETLVKCHADLPGRW